MEQISKKESHLETLRKEAKITQDKLAEKLGVRTHTYRNWIKGRAVARLTVEQMKTLCRELNVTLDQLPNDFGPQ